MMLKRVYLTVANLGQLDLAPQATMRVSVAALHHDLGIDFEKGSDDLNAYDAAYYRLDDHVVALIHHQGEPLNSVSVYLDRGLGPRKAQKLVNKMVSELGVDHALVNWVETEILRDHTG